MGNARSTVVSEFAAFGAVFGIKQDGQSQGGDNWGISTHCLLCYNECSSTSTYSSNISQDLPKCRDI